MLIFFLSRGRGGGVDDMPQNKPLTYHIPHVYDSIGHRYYVLYTCSFIRLDSNLKDNVSLTVKLLLLVAFSLILILLCILFFSFM